MSTKHTPGPWSFGYGDHICIEDKDERIIAFCNLQNENGDEDEANAKLIAAAPETKRQRDALLEALKETLRCNHELGAISRPVADQARAAIAMCEKDGLSPRRPA
jgi:hypothetical protein